VATRLLADLVNVTVSLRPFESRKRAFLPIEGPRDGHRFSHDDIRILEKAIGRVADIEDVAASLRMECNVTSDQVLHWMTWPQILAHLKHPIEGQDGTDRTAKPGTGTWEVPWDETNVEYMPSGEARTTFTDGKLSASALSKDLGTVPVHYMRKPGRGCRIHVGEFRGWAEREYLTDTTRGEIVDEWVADCETHEAEKRSKNRRK